MFTSNIFLFCTLCCCMVNELMISGTYFVHRSVYYMSTHHVLCTKACVRVMLCRVGFQSVHIQNRAYHSVRYTAGTRHIACAKNGEPHIAYTTTCTHHHPCSVLPPVRAILHVPLNVPCPMLRLTQSCQTISSRRVSSQIQNKIR